MYASVELDDKPVIVAVEIRDVVAELVLPPELQPHEPPGTHQFPEKVLSRCPLLSESPRSFDQP